MGNWIAPGDGWFQLKSLFKSRNPEREMNNQATIDRDLGTKNGSILIVDDLKENLQILNSILSEEGYCVRSAINGRLALNSARANPPDLILLDIRMPEMDGYETCHYLKIDDDTKDIPVIFLSALRDVDSKVNGFKAGAVDYITKPFEIDEILARVDTHLTIRKLQNQLVLKNQALEKVARHREEVEDIIHHDIKGPLLPIINFPGLIRKNPALTEKQLKFLDRIEQAGYRILKLIERSDFLIQMENHTYSVQSMPIDLIQVIENVRGDLSDEISKNSIAVNLILNNKSIDPSNDFFILGDEFLCYTMFVNLIKNAIEASVENQTVTISLRENNLAQELVIHSQTTVPEGIRDRFFEKYATYGKKKGTGLGTYSAKLAAETMGGQIDMTTSEESGTSVRIVFSSPQEAVQI